MNLRIGRARSWALAFALGASACAQACSVGALAPGGEPTHAHEHPGLAVGDVVVTRDGERFSVVANEAKRIVILKKLAEAAGIEAYADRGPKQTTMSLDIHDAPIVDIVRAVAEKDRYWLIYDHDSERSEHRLSEIMVGGRADRVARLTKSVMRLRAAKDAEKKARAEAQNGAAEGKDEGNSSEGGRGEDQ